LHIAVISRASIPDFSPTTIRAENRGQIYPALQTYLQQSASNGPLEIDMKFLKTVLALAASLFLAACTIESDIVLPDPTAAGDVIVGLPADKPFKLETLEKSSNAYKAFATLTPEREGEAVRYIVAFDDGTPNRLVVQAKRISDDNYLLRFAQTIDGVRPSLGESGLAFLSIKDGDYYLMSSLSDDGWIEEIFAPDARPRGAGSSTISLDTFAQAEKISAWFAANRQRMTEIRDFTKFRLAK
jgi:hypothetical protein